MLDGQFECEVYMEEIEQDLREPCFFISCVSPADKQYPGKRHKREQMFDICYFPESEKDAVAECNMVAEKLYWCLEEVEVLGKKMRGYKMHYEVADGVLHFFVNYNFFVHRTETNTLMGTLSRDTRVERR